MDIEGYMKSLLMHNDKKLKKKTISHILDIKKISKKRANLIFNAVLEEIHNSNRDQILNNICLVTPSSCLSVGSVGVGSRGIGDFYVHNKIADIIGTTKAIIDSSDLDDSGIIEIDGKKYIAVTVDGIHSRLSSYPFLSGFHAARAALRDIYSVGACPIALLSDIHVSDDCDISMIFDHISGITTVSELVDVPLITGSTLRIGGDMVIGTRMTGCVGSVGIICNDKINISKNNIKDQDVILMTVGSGGGTIATTAIYSNYQFSDKIIDNTLNVDFIVACKNVLSSEFAKEIHFMTDITNGGIRGDFNELSISSKMRYVLNENKLMMCVQKDLLKMLKELNIDYLGVSIDSLMIICSKKVAFLIIEFFNKLNIKSYVVGNVEKGIGVYIKKDGKVEIMNTLFRESPYTPLKKIIGTKKPNNWDYISKTIDLFAEKSLEKKKLIVNKINNKLNLG